MYWPFCRGGQWMKTISKATGENKIMVPVVLSHQHLEISYKPDMWQAIDISIYTFNKFLINLITNHSLNEWAPFMCTFQVNFNSLWPGDSTWWHSSGSTLAQVMAGCLTAPSHYLNQCWLLISEALWHLPGSNFTASAPTIILYYEFENYTSKITATSLRGQWVKDQCWSHIDT